MVSCNRYSLRLPAFYPEYNKLLPASYPWAAAAGPPDIMQYSNSNRPKQLLKPLVALLPFWRGGGGGGEGGGGNINITIIKHLLIMILFREQTSQQIYSILYTDFCEFNNEIFYIFMNYLNSCTFFQCIPACFNKSKQRTFFLA